LRAGPKAAVTAAPLDLSGLGRKRRTRAVRFIEAFLRVPKGEGALDPVRLRPWQVDLVRAVLADGVRQGLVSLPRGNGKTTLAAMLAVWGLFDGPEGAQVLTVASDERQARLVWNAARRMIELNPVLAEQVQVFQDRIYCPHHDGTLAPLPADAASLQGWDPSLAIVDELHVVYEGTFEAMALASGKRAESLLLAISTPADDPDSVMWRLVEHGRAQDDPAFGFIEYAAPDGCAVDDETAWKVANPALGDFLALDALRATLKTTREPSFRRFRLGQWVGQVDTWLPWGMWDGLVDTVRDPAGEQVVLGFDGSASGDSTALVGATVDGAHVFVVDVWANPGDLRWRVPRGDVDAAVDLAFERYEVVELACDPWGWRSEIEQWADRHGERVVVEWPTNVVSRMAPATDRVYQAAATGRLTHDGDVRLAAHVANATAKTTAHGDVIVKDRRGSTRKIDAAVAAIVAFDRAAWHANRPTKRRRVLVT
jgi:phage terminase large subunit-like protein